jgi:hypothetical protein
LDFFGVKSLKLGKKKSKEEGMKRMWDYLLDWKNKPEKMILTEK